MATSSSNPSQTSEYFAPCGLSLGELSNLDSNQLLSLLFAKCSICASTRRLNLAAVFNMGKGDFIAECDGVPSFPLVPLVLNEV